VLRGPQCFRSPSGSSSTGERIDATVASRAAVKRVASPLIESGGFFCMTSRSSSLDGPVFALAERVDLRVEELRDAAVASGKARLGR